MIDPTAGPAPETRLLSERDGRRRPRERTEPVPRALETPLRGWLERFLHPHLEQRIAVRLELELTPRDHVPSPVGPPRELARHPALGTDWLLLDAVDLALQWDQALANQFGIPSQLSHDDEGEPLPKFGRLLELDDLTQLLDDGGSTYDVWAPAGAATPMLTVRVDPTAQAAIDTAIKTAGPTSAGKLRQAWTKVYGRDLDPDGAYSDAVRAVEMLACPLVIPNSTRATLSSVARHLRDAPQKWELVLTKLGDGTVEPIVEMFDRLWHGNLASRHGSLDYREVTLEEARAGVQLAVLLVQWLTDGVLRRRTSP